MSINVNRNNPDQFYRYKMPRLIAKVEGKGNGIKTVIVNMTDIAKALSRPPTYPTKYFGCELGAQTQFDVKNERYIVNGAHDAAKLQDLLDGFIRKFVLCRECDNPETSLAVNVKKQTILQRCIACGYQCQLGANHKLTTFILKYPPDAPDHAGDAGSKKEGDKRNGTSKKKTKGSTGSDEDTSKTTADTGVNAQEQSAAIRSGDHIISAPAAVKTTGASDDDDDWCEDTSEEAQRRRMKELSEGAAQLTMSADLQKTPQQRVDMFYDFVKAKKETNGGLASVEKEICAEADRLDVKDKAPLILAELLFTQNIVKEIKDNHRLLLRFTANNDKGQKYLLGAFEKIVGDLYKDALMPKVPHILKTMYDLDLVDEPVFFDWHSKVSKKYVKKSVSQEIHTHAAPFIKWLKEAEEESDESDGDGDSNAKSEEEADDSEEEEEDDGLEVAFSSTEKMGTQVVKAPVPNGNTAAGEEEDINIDDI